MRKGKRPPTRRTPVAAITDHVLDLFDQMEALAQQCTCGSDTRHECDACAQWWRQHRELHRELKLRPWEYPTYSNFENDDPQAMARYRVLKAASDARSQKHKRPIKLSEVRCKIGDSV